jgi:predicted SnoaL-like aldol condensation-catalyzing enzyme
MSTEEERNKEIIRRWNTGDNRWMAELVHEAYTNHSGTAEPWSTVVDGRDDFIEQRRQGKGPAADLSVEIEEIIAEGDMVAVRMTLHTGDEPIANAMTFYRLRDGKIVDDWFCHTMLDET